MKHKNVPNSNHIENCNFVGVQWDSKAVATVQTIPDGLLENAKAFHSLISVLKAQNVEIKAMLNIETPRGEK
jgi:hypothetical protein